MTNMKHGDFTGLANTYSKYRPAYSETILTALLSILEKNIQEIDFVDIGAGTGIWTRMVTNRGCRSITAVEPNDDMRTAGIEDSKDFPIKWIKAQAEETGLLADSADFLTMASSFHWTNFDKAMNEFARILRPGGRFAALWNPRKIDDNPLLVEIENKLLEFVPDLKRVSSGRSGITATLTEKLENLADWDDVTYFEAKHVAHQTPEQYLGVWWSVNDIRVQAGPEAFKAFMDYVEARVKNLKYIETKYLTRAWSAQKN